MRSLHGGEQEHGEEEDEEERQWHVGTAAALQEMDHSGLNLLEPS
jgi:hypothetical protein